jgi:hypothetical protein
VYLSTGEEIDRTVTVLSLTTRFKRLRQALEPRRFLEDVVYQRLIMVERMRIELTTFALRTRRSPS